MVGSLVLAGLLGCASARRNAADTPTEECAGDAATNVLAAAAVPAAEPPPDGYAWEDLARLAASNSAAAKVLLFDAEAERRQIAVDTGWRNPQLRVGGKTVDEEEKAVDNAGKREWADKNYDGYTTALRVYVANPFVNRWLRQVGTAKALAVEAEAEETKYAVYCEVKSLCLEADMLRSELEVMERMIALRQEMRDTCAEQMKAGVAGALDVVRAETRLASLRPERSAKELARRQIVRRIALLTGVPAERLHLRPHDAARLVNDAFLNEATLTDLAFFRRPDLRKALYERDAARHGLNAAKAGNIPWFEYVEGSYEDGTRHSSSVEEGLTGSGRMSEGQTEWQARAAITLPVFNWLGDEVRLNQTRLAAAEAHAQDLYDQIRREVEGVLEDYRSVRAERDRAASENRQLIDKMTAQINALANEAAVPRGDVLAAREDVLDYSRTVLRAEHEFLKMAQCLETVSGGSLVAPQ